MWMKLCEASLVSVFFFARPLASGGMMVVLLQVSATPAGRGSRSSTIIRKHNLVLARYRPQLVPGSPSKAKPMVHIEVGPKCCSQNGLDVEKDPYHNLDHDMQARIIARISRQPPDGQ